MSSKVATTLLQPFDFGRNAGKSTVEGLKGLGLSFLTSFGPLCYRDMLEVIINSGYSSGKVELMSIQLVEIVRMLLKKIDNGDVISSAYLSS